MLIIYLFLTVIALYQDLRTLGLSDDHIILMLADAPNCDLRNPYPGTVFIGGPARTGDVCSQGPMAVDFRGREVTGENVLRLLTGYQQEWEPRNRRLLTDEGSNLLIYLSGHGGDGFLKFQDTEELTTQDLAMAFEKMHTQHRFREVFMITETCQAATLADEFYTRGILAVGSSLRGENSYSQRSDAEVCIIFYVPESSHIRLLLIFALFRPVFPSLIDSPTIYTNICKLL